MNNKSFVGFQSIFEALRKYTYMKPHMLFGHDNLNKIYDS
jgi:hypothetical protein